MFFDRFDAALDDGLYDRQDELAEAARAEAAYDDPYGDIALAIDGNCSYIVREDVSIHGTVYGLLTCTLADTD